MIKVMQTETKNEFKSFVHVHKAEILTIASVLGVAVLGYLGCKYSSELRLNSTIFLSQATDSKSIVTTIDNIRETIKPVVEGKIPRYRVEFKSFKKGEWYPKTITDYINSAYSVGACKSFGRAWRIIDTETGKVVKEVLEDASMASCNGYPNGHF